MRRLDNQEDGRRYAIDTLRLLERAGTEKCRADVPAPYTHQADALILALLELKERATCDAVIGFAVVLTDLAGTRCHELADLYEDMRHAGKIRGYKLKRALKRRGCQLTTLAMRREAEAEGVAAPKAP